MTTWNTVLEGIREDVEEPIASIWSDATILRHYNDAVSDFARKTHVWEDEQYATATVGQASYDLPTGTLDVTGVYFSDMESALSRQSQKGFVSYAQASEDGEPYIYSVFDGALWLYPTPDTTGTIRFFRTLIPGAVTATGDSTPFDSQYDFVLTKYVKARLYEQLGDYDLANRLQQMYDRDVMETEWQRIRNVTADRFTMPAQEW